MFRAIAFLVVGVGLGLGVLTCVPTPPWVPWRIGVLATEFGHWLAGAMVVVAALLWVWRGAHGRFAFVALGLAVVAAALLLKPAAQAWRLGRALPAQLDAAFGAAPAAGEAAFSFGALFASAPEPVAVQTLSFRSHGELAIDFYRPAASARRRTAAAAPCVIVVHGGGWDGGDRTEIAHFNHWLAHQGYAVAAIDYRLAPQFQWPAQRDDTLAAIAFLKSRAAELAVDPARLVLLGRSAGGQIATTVAYTANDPAIRGVVALYMPSDLDFGYRHTTEDDAIKSPALMRQFLGGTPDTARANYASASALRHVTPAAPPTLLVHGENDPLVWHRHSVRLAARLAEARVPHAFVSLPWATHACEYNLHGPGGQLTTFSIARFLAAVTRS